jgi:NIMA-interacting peptidyl-prolyl cis-trans isomerase 4
MTSGGSLGWKGKGTLMPEFEKVAFELEVSSIASPKWAEYVSPAHIPFLHY